MRQINVYEFSGIVCPGVLFIVELYFLFPETFINIVTFNLEGFGVLLIVAFCIGHIIQGVANILEDVTDYPKRRTRKMLKKYNINKPYQDIYITLQRKGGTERIDIFNRLYGLMRGLFVNFLLLCFIISIFTEFDYKIYLLLLELAGVCFYRARHFSDLYSRELVFEYKKVKNIK